MDSVNSACVAFSSVWNKDVEHRNWIKNINILRSLRKRNDYIMTNKYDANGKLYNTHIQSEDCYKENDYKTTATRSYQEPTNVSG